MKQQDRITVYYDGLCRLCSAEIEHYRRQEGAAMIGFVDITKPGFDAAKEGLDPFAVHRELHVRREDGQTFVGVQSFIEIWSVLPKYRWAAALAKRPVIHRGLGLGYAVFAKVRPYLPRKKQDCSDSPYCELKDA